MLPNGKQLRLHVNMVGRGSCMAAGCEAEAAILHNLETAKRGRRIIWIDNRRSIVNDGANQRFVGDDKAFLVSTEPSVCKCAQNKTNK